MSSVYFIGGNGVVKIGVAKNVAKRLKNIQTSCPFSLTVLRVISGGELEERWLHNHYLKNRTHGEWFSYSQCMESIVPKVDVENPPLKLISSTRKTNPTWDAVKRIGEENGATSWAISKWAYRGVPDAWKIKIVRQSAGAVSFDDLDAFDPKQVAS